MAETLHQIEELDRATPADREIEGLQLTARLSFEWLCTSHVPLYQSFALYIVRLGIAGCGYGNGIGRDSFGVRAGWC